MMSSMFLVALLSLPHSGGHPASSNSIAILAPSTETMVVPADDPIDELDQWIDELLKLLDWLCDILGEGYCDAEAANVDEHLIAFTSEYDTNGIPGGLTATEKAEARGHITDLLELLDEPLAGTPAVIDDAIEAFEFALGDLQ